MNIDEIKKFDPQKMYEVYDNWAILARDAYEKELPKIHFEDIDPVSYTHLTLPTNREV